MMTTEITFKNDLTESEICAKYSITTAQLDKATKILDCRTGEVFYQVQSQTTDAVYELRYVTAHRCITCTCPAGNPPLTDDGDYAYATRPCWHKRAAAACAFVHRQEENIAYRKEAAEAAAARKVVAKADTHQDVSLTTLNTAQRQRGYDIRIQRDGSTWLNEKSHGWANEGELPGEWWTVCNDPSVVSAVCFPSTQRTWTPAKRRHVAEYQRNGAVVTK